jgi:hypothetical protein
MRHVLGSSLLALAVTLAGCGQEGGKPDDLPWQITLDAAGNPQVFHLEIGKSTLKEVIEHLHNFPEMAVFSYENGKRTLEAYFGTQRMGLFEAKIIAELQADDATLTRFQQNASKREGMASGQWKYTLGEKDVQAADSLAVRKLVYMPAVNYEPDIALARFGQPAERLPSAAKSGVEFWTYPDKGLIILMNNDGGEILYYVTREVFPQLKQELLEAKPKNAQQ